GAEREFPVHHLRVFEPLVRAGPHREFSPGADGAHGGLHEDLVRGRGGEIDLADAGLVRLGDNGLTCVHLIQVQGSCLAARGAQATRARSPARTVKVYEIRPAARRRTAYTIATDIATRTPGALT